MQDMVEMAGFQPVGALSCARSRHRYHCPAAQYARVVPSTTLQKQRAQGRPGASSHPRPVCIGSKHTVVTTGGAGSSGLPCAMVLRLISRSPRGPGTFAPVIGGLLRQLDTSVGVSGPRDFAVRFKRVRLTRHQRPPHPALYVPVGRDDSIYSCFYRVVKLNSEIPKSMKIQLWGARTSGEGK
jgi:hypothetical protein